MLSISVNANEHLHLEPAYLGHWDANVASWVEVAHNKNASLADRQAAARELLYVLEPMFDNESSVFQSEYNYVILLLLADSEDEAPDSGASQVFINNDDEDPLADADIWTGPVSVASSPSALLSVFPDLLQLGTALSVLADNPPAIPVTDVAPEVVPVQTAPPHSISAPAQVSPFNPTPPGSDNLPSTEVLAWVMQQPTVVRPLVRILGAASVLGRR